MKKSHNFVTYCDIAKPTDWLSRVEVNNPWVMLAPPLETILFLSTYKDVEGQLKRHLCQWL